MEASRFFAALVLIGALALDTPTLGDVSTPPRFPSGQISVADWKGYLTEVKAISDVHCQDYAANQYVCDSRERRTIWVFTREGHPAHPAVSRGVMVVSKTDSGTIIGIDRSGHYAGDADAFRKWMSEFVILDKRQVAEWNQMFSRDGT